MNLREAITKYLLTVSEITSALSTYEFTSGSPAPAIFGTDVVPKDAGDPVIHVGKPVGGTNFETKSYEGGEIFLDVNMYNDKKSTQKTFDELANTVWLKLNRADLSSYISGWRVYNLVATPPQGFSDENGFPAYRIGVSCKVLKDAS